MSSTLPSLMSCDAELDGLIKLAGLIRELFVEAVVVTLR
jgi:hypothetical protein